MNSNEKVYNNNDNSSMYNINNYMLNNNYMNNNNINNFID